MQLLTLVDKLSFMMLCLKNDLRYEKSGFLTQTGMCSYRRGLEALNFRFTKKTNCTIHVMKIKVLISCEVTAQLICTFVFS